MNSSLRIPGWWLPAALLALLPAAVSVAVESEALTGFGNGFLHPLLGWDHLCALLALGIWAAQLGGAARAALPGAALAAMSLGGILGLQKMPLPAVESGILTSLLLLGTVLAAGLRATLPGAIGLTALFGVFHGHAHGTELAVPSEAVGYAAGFLLTSSLLLGLGGGLGWLALRLRQPRLARWSGWATLTSGAVLLLNKL